MEIFQTEDGNLPEFHLLTELNKEILCYDQTGWLYLEDIFPSKLIGRREIHSTQPNSLLDLKELYNSVLCKNLSGLCKTPVVCAKPQWYVQNFSGLCKNQEFVQNLSWWCKTSGICAKSQWFLQNLRDLSKISVGCTKPQGFVQNFSGLCNTWGIYAN